MLQTLESIIVVLMGLGTIGVGVATAVYRAIYKPWHHTQDRIENVEKTVDSHGKRITQLEKKE